MKAMILGILFLSVLGVQAQVKGIIDVSTTLKEIKISEDSLGFDIKIYIVNKDSITYYYPKAFEQILEGKVLSRTFNFSLQPHKVIDLSSKIGSTEYNSYDTLIAIKPDDSLIIQYREINVLYLKKSSQTVYIKSYITNNKDAIKLSKEGNTYLDRYDCSVKKIEYKLTYGKGGPVEKVSVTSNCPNSSFSFLQEADAIKK